MDYEHACEVVSGYGGYFNFEAIQSQTGEVLDRYSAEGWELVSAVAGDNANSTKVMMFFKRPAR
ncbi:hypothetical protein GCM10027059_30320 [Myceligenerans halotolerans]